MAVHTTGQQVHVRVDETDRKQGLTFADLCELVDKAREIGIDPTTPVIGDDWITNRIKGRDGYRIRWIEV